MPIAPEGRPLVLAAAAPTALTGLAALFTASGWAWGLFFLLALATGVLLFFFRDPRRVGPRGSELIVAAGDGRVIRVDTVEEPEYLRGPARRVAVFLSLLDVHVNRYPVGGTVEHRSERPGGYVAAYREDAEEANAQVSVGIRTERGERVLVRQITGLVARRIVNHAREGNAVEQGGRMGLIRFGSRVDVFFPVSAEVSVTPGSRAVGGVTVLARLRPGPGP